MQIWLVAIVLTQIVGSASVSARRAVISGRLQRSQTLRGAGSLEPPQYFHVVFTLPAEIAAIALQNGAVGFGVAVLLNSVRDPGDRESAVDGINIMTRFTGYALTPVT